MVIGGNSNRNSISGEVFKGYIKNVKIYNRALKANEILKY